MMPQLRRSCKGEGARHWTGPRDPGTMVGAVNLTHLLLGRDPRRTLLRVAVLIAVSYGTFGYALLPIRGEGISMLPAFGSGQIGFVNVLAYTWTEPERGDIVAIRMAGRRVMYVKRVIGLPGEGLSIAAGTCTSTGVRWSSRTSLEGRPGNWLRCALASISTSS